MFLRWQPKSVDDELANALAGRTDFIVGDYPLKKLSRVNNEGTVLLRRHGALGDIVVLYPAIRKIKQVLPFTFSLACGSPYISLFRGDDTFEEVIVTGASLKKKVIGTVLLDGVLERDLGTPRPEYLVPRVFAYYKFLTHGFDVPKTFKPDYLLKIGEQDKIWASRIITRIKEKNDRPIIFIQARGSGPVRSIGRERMRELTVRLSNTYNVLVTDKNESYCWKDEANGIFQAPGQRPFLNFIELIRQCDAALTTDSGIQWLAHAAGTPLVSILGPTRESEKVATHPDYPMRAKGINTALLFKCEPCFENAVKCKWKYSCLRELNIDILWEEVKRCISEVLSDGYR